MSTKPRHLASIVRDSGLAADLGAPTGTSLDALIEALAEELEGLHRAHEALKTREREHRALVEDALFGVLIHRNWTPLYINAAYAHLLGYDSPEELMAAGSVERHIAPHDRERRRRFMRERMAGDEAPDRYDFEALRKDGSTLTLNNVARVVTWQGEPAIQSTVSDVTDHRRVEQALRWSEQRFRDFSDAAGDWFWEMDSELRFTYISHRFTEVTGLETASFLGRHRSQVAPTENEPGKWAAHLEDLDEHRPFRDFVYWIVDPDGRRRYFRINGLPIFGPDGVFLGYRGTGLETTEQVEAEARVHAAERRFVEALENISDGYALFDAEDQLVTCNSAWHHVLNRRIADLLVPGMKFEDGMRENVRRGTVADAAGREEAWIEDRLERHRRADGMPFEIDRGNGVWHQVREYRTRDGGTMVISTDISELKAREHALSRSEQRFRDFAETAADWFWEMDAEFRTTYVSERFQEITGAAPAEVLGVSRAERERRRGLDPAHFDRVFGKFAEHQAFEDFEYEARTPDGQTRVLNLSAKPLFDADGHFAGYRGTGRDVTRAHSLAQEMAYQAAHDSLTGLANRREFEARLDRVLATVRNDDSEHALCYLDLDQFKVINDTCGHAAGDELLRRLAALLKTRVRRRDTLARLGGDEFGVLMEHCTLLQARRVADSLRRTVEAFRFRWEDKSFGVGVSIGLVPVTASSGGLTEVLRAGDSACYVAKDQGRNRIHLYDPDDEELARRHGEMQWVTRIDRALEHDELFLMHQTITPVGLPPADGVLYEVLVRMREADATEVPPGAFLPAAERYQLASRIDRWVVRNVLDWLTRHPRHQERLGLCSINISGQSVGDVGFLHFVLEQLEAHGIPGHKFCFEITETAAIGDIEGALRLMRALRERGCRFALDDFGSGLSSFAYLKTLLVDFVKIDGAFVRGLADSSVDAALVRSINDVGHAMGKRTIAEYVENEHILHELQGIGVDYAQGFHIARPRPFED